MVDNMNYSGSTSMNGGMGTSSDVQRSRDFGSALGNLDIDQIKSQVISAVRAGDEIRRNRPALFWGTVAAIGIVFSYILMRPSRSY